MSTPAGPLAVGHSSCCDGRAPVTLARFLSVVPSAEPGMRSFILARGGDPDTLWCHSCATVLENLRDGFAEGGPTFLRFVATIASVVPGVGTGIASVLGTAASLAEGASLSDALVAGTLAALPAGPAWAAAGAAASGVLDGQRIDRAALAGVRAGIAAEGGPAAAAAFDGLMAIAQGKSLQDAGFSGLAALAAGNDVAERAAHYLEVVARAAETGRSVEDVLVSELKSEVSHNAGFLADAAISPMLARLALDPSLLRISPAALAALYGVAEPLARAALSIMRTGVEDTALRARLVSVRSDSVASRVGSRAVRLGAGLRNDSVTASAGGASRAVREALAGSGLLVVAPPSPVVAAPPVAAPSPPRARTSPIGDVALGATIAAAVVALVWWRSSS